MARIAPELLELTAGLSEEEAPVITSLFGLLEERGEVLELPTLQPFLTFVDVIGTGIRVTQLGRLRSETVQHFAEVSGATEFWQSAATTEMNTAPVAKIHWYARALHLVEIHGHDLRVSYVGRQLGRDPRAWVEHIAGALPFRPDEFERQAGWLTLLVVASGLEPAEWRECVADALVEIGWGIDIDGESFPPDSWNHTLSLLDLLTKGFGNEYVADPFGMLPEEDILRNHAAVAALARRAVLLD